MAQVTRLVLMRHATAQAHAASDHERPLTAQGRSEARMAGQWLRDHDLLPDVCLVSSATRTVETCTALQLSVPCAPDDRLYNASAEDLAALVRALPESVRCAVLIAHNPGVSELAALAGHHKGLAPAAAVALECDGPWADFLVSEPAIVAAYVAGR